MRPLALALGLALAPAAHAADVEFGVDADLAFAYGQTLKGPGGGLTAHLGVGPNPLALGPSALSILFEAHVGGYRFPSADEPTVDFLRAGVGARGILTLLWLRKPEDQGGRGRGVRIDLPISLHGGVGTLDGATTITPMGDATLGLALGLLPVQIGLHVGGGGLAASPDPETLEGMLWVDAGLDVGFVF